MGSFQTTLAEPAVVRLGVTLQPTSALVLIALQQGYFAAAGLEVQTTDYPSGKRALQEGLFKGRVDVASAADVPVALMGLERSDVRLLASIASVDDVNRIVARRDRAILRPADLRGKRIATQKGSAVHFFLYLFLLRQGLTTQDVTLSFLPAEQLPEALARGDIDAFSMREPYVSQAQGLLGDKTLVFPAPGLYPQFELLLAQADLVRQRPEVARALLRGLLRAEQFAAAEPRRAAALVAARLRAEPNAIAAVWPQFRLKVELTQALLLGLEGEAEWAMEAGLTPRRSLPDYLAMIYLDGLDAARPAAVTVIH